MITVSLSSLTAYLPPEAVRGRSSHDVLDAVRAAALADTVAP
ncbi:MAG: hypothetical protein WCJ30_25990 [Deltaproteobacteria bacterium]